MVDKNIIGKYWGAVWATFALVGYFLWASGKSSAGEADHNISFYIVGCGLYFVIYFLAERICFYRGKADISRLCIVCIVIAFMAVIWILFSYVKDPELFPNYAWGIHDFPIILHFILLVGITCCLNIGINVNVDSGMRNKKLRVAVLLLVTTLQVSLLYAPNIWVDTGGGIYHVHAYTNSIINTLSNQPFDDSNYSIYGHYALFYGIVVRILNALLGTSGLTSIIIAICMFGAVTFAICFYILDKLIQNDVVFCVSAVAFSVISTFAYGAGQYYQVLPHRIIFQALALYGAWYVIYVKKNKALLWIISICAVIWNIEIGFICCAAYFVLEMWFDIEKTLFNRKNWFGIALCAIKNLIIMILRIASAYIIVNTYNIFNGGTWNSLKTFMLPLANPDYMLGSLPTSLPDVFAGYFLEIILFMGMLCYCVNMLFTLKCEEGNRNRYIFMIFNSLVGLGSLTYYMNRAARANLYIAHVELVILLAVLIDQKAVRLKLRCREFSLNYVKSIIKVFALIILASLVFDSVRDVGMAYDKRMQTSWNTDSLNDLCKTIQETVPEGTIGFGTGVPELYSAIGWDTGVYVGDWSDYNLFNMTQIDDVMMDSEQIFAHRESFAMNPKYINYMCRRAYEINGNHFGLYIKNESCLTEGSYMVSPKRDTALTLCTKGGNRGKVFLEKEKSYVSLTVNDNIYHINFEEYQVALDVPSGRIDDNGTVQVWSANSTDGQKWIVGEVDGYYMICFNDYALTYNLDDNSINLKLATGDDDQLWLFTN